MIKLKSPPNQENENKSLWTVFSTHLRKNVSWGSYLNIYSNHKFELGKNSRLEKGVVIDNFLGDIIIHDEVHTGIGCIIIGPVELHKHVGLSQYVSVLGTHKELNKNLLNQSQTLQQAPIIMEEDAFVSTGTIIQGKANGETLTLGRYCRVGANSVIVDDIPPYAVAVGNPARIVKIWDFELEKWVRPKTDE